jgi:hypothetical protein
VVRVAKERLVGMTGFGDKVIVEHGARSLLDLPVSQVRTAYWVVFLELCHVRSDSVLGVVKQVAGVPLFVAINLVEFGRVGVPAKDARQREVHLARDPEEAVVQ